MPTHAELKSLAEQYLADAIILMQAGRHDGAVYMCGYVLEAALKARICKHLRLSQYPPPSYREADRIFKIHRFEELKVLAGLGDDFPQGANPQLQANWSLVSGWVPEWRYRPPGSVTRQTAVSMVKALADTPDGLLTWLKKRW
jgi:hypothetical protein